MDLRVRQKMCIIHRATQILVLILTTICLLAPKFLSLEIENDKQALLHFKSNLHDPLNYLESWNSSNSPCEFFGITCNTATKKVTKISLINLDLAGGISSSLSHLQTLTSLNFACNSFSGFLPLELRNLTRLQYLNLSNNSLIGEIPDFSMLDRLEVFDLAENRFTGNFPVWVGNLTSLNVLMIGSNEFKEAKIPKSIANLKNLTRLFLGGMNLIGELPDFIFDLRQLEMLEVQRNNLFGKIPSSISQLNKLVILYLFSNNFTGELPREIANLTLLEDFDISTNQFHGSLPPEIGELNFLAGFQLFENHFSGNLPKGLANLPLLTDFSIYRNRFSGKFPRNFGMNSLLSLIDISENEFSGEFPPHLCENKMLEYLLALDNLFIGEFPKAYSNCKVLTRIRVSQNLMDGIIPNGLWEMPKVGLIDLSHNSFTGRITSNIKLSSNLSQIILSNNRLFGELPQEIGYLTKLERLVLSNNAFSGKIPQSVKYLKSLSLLQLDGNSFSGFIPSELGQCTTLAQINLAGNSLIGSIPDSISKLHLDSFNVSRNNLSGLIAPSLVDLKLSIIDLSENQLSGSIPIELYMIGGDNGFLGNKRLCLPLNLAKHFESKIRSCNDNQSSRESSFHLFALLYALFSTIVIVIISFIGVIIYHKRTSIRRIYTTKCQDEVEDNREWTYKKFHPKVKISTSDMKRLNRENVIGKGSTSIVYKLDLNGNEGEEGVAVKILQEQAENKKEMLNFLSTEIEILGKVRHKNILKLYAYFKKGRSHYLVLELMEKGNLHEELHGEASTHRVLDMNTRYKIAIGVAQAITYLHHDCSPSIVHGDIKSNNILLNMDYDAKVSDFGIAKCSDMTTNSIKLMGTHGYMAPKLAYSIKATKKSDVYSFGVVVLELLTGRQLGGEDFGEGRDLVSWANHLWCSQNGVLELLDGRLSRNASILTSTSTTHVLDDSLRKMMQIARQCTVTDPLQRPSMRNVVKVFHV